MSLACRIVGHKRDSQRTWHDGLDWRSNCRRCHQPLVKDDQDWRVFDREKDFDVRRAGKPERKG